MAITLNNILSHLLKLDIIVDPVGPTDACPPPRQSIVFHAVYGKTLLK